MQEPNIVIRPAEPEDYRGTEELTREAFWNVYRPGCMEHYVLHCFRGDPDRIPQLDLVMELDGKIVGQALCVRGEILCDDGRRAPVLNLGPIGIAPELKRRGYGKRLLDTCLERARALGAGVMVLTGNPDFYGRSGFVPAKTRGIRYADDPEAAYFLLRELEPGYLDGIAGTYRDPAGYFVCERDPEGFVRFEATFPPKEKKVLPGQLG